MATLIAVPLGGIASADDDPNDTLPLLPTDSPVPPTATPRPTPTPNALSYYVQGIKYFSNGKYQLAINELTTAIRLEPEQSALYYWRGSAYGSLGQYQRAIQDYIRR